MNVCRDGLHARLGKLKPHDTLKLKTPQERNRALKYARDRGLIFASRFEKEGVINLWRIK